MADSINAIVLAALGPVFGQRVFPDVAPAKTPRPRATYQSVGGEPSVTLDGMSTTRNCRMQINVWADDRETATASMEQAIAALCGDDVKGVPIGEPVSVHEEDTNLYGSRLDISIWYST